MILSALAFGVKGSGRGKYMVVITIMTLKEASYQDKPVKDLKQLDKVDVLCAEIDEIEIVVVCG